VIKYRLEQREAIMRIDNPAADRSRFLHVSKRANSRVLLASLAGLCFGAAAEAQTVVPSNAKATDPACTVSTGEFTSWFASLPVAANGIVNPADSILFPNLPNCTFYKWAAQMFLWLTSPAPTTYGPGTHVFNSPVFYDVSPADPTTGNRTLVPIVPGRPRNFSARISQLGPLNRPVVFDQTGKMFTVIRPQVGPTGKSLIKDKAGQAVEIARTQVAPGGKPVFLDKAGKTIDFQVAKNGSPLLLDRAGKAIDFRLTRKIINGRPFFVDGAGNLIDTEQGEADGNVLMSQNNSLVYYAIEVNDVYAYFLTGQKNGAISATKFPTTPTNLIAINQFAASHNKFFPDANALAVEVKSSWVETSTLPPGEVSKYVTMTATVPNYTQTSAMLWTANGTKTVQLAMTGIHVVGSTGSGTVGHPEMIWATFEHVNNTRNSPYNYNTNAGTVPGPADGPGPWNFSTSPTSATPNQPVIAVSGADLVSSTAIGPSDILRVNPWGMPGSNAASNSEIISVNHSVLSQLVGADLRKNYILTGSTWTIGGAPPSGGNQVGTNQMANSTMESFFQPSNCFSCHTGSNMLGTPSGDGLSHIYGPLQPLFP
jgi:hypothetical protein